MGDEGLKLIESLIIRRKRSLVFEETARRLEETQDPEERRRLWDEFHERVRNP